MKLTKKKIEEMVMEIVEMLIKKECWGDINIYFNEKKLCNCSPRKEYDYENKYWIYENEDPRDYFSYVAKKHIMSMSFEGSLYDAINYGDGGYVTNELDKILDKYGLYYELGNAWNLTIYKSDGDYSDVEYTDYSEEEEMEEVIHIYASALDIPKILMDIYTEWYSLSREVGDVGSCVLGAGFNFKFKGKSYFMFAASPYQGSISWETPRNDIQKKLENIGCTDIWYNWGRLD